MKKFGVEQIIVIAIGLFAIVSIIPSLLDAKNDIAVFIGVGLILAIIFGIYKYWEKIIDFFSFDDNEKGE